MQRPRGQERGRAAACHQGPRRAIAAPFLSSACCGTDHRTPWPSARNPPSNRSSTISTPADRRRTRRRDPRVAAAGGTAPARPTHVALHEAAQSRYLNYALSVITARALPDVRDGLKPVQRRILYTMWQQNLTADAKHRKCAKVVGDVMGSYHPHGDAALYETLVRMAQSFSLRYPLVDGSGNFGSLDGDSAAAMRYTECRLARISDEMLTEIEQTTVPFRPNYDGTKTEPVVLPARIPNLLVNGTTGIAVGMATNIPPHNLGEVCTALVKLLDNEDIGNAQLCRYIKGPDFPTGGQILNSPEELKEIYKTGSGSIRLRGTWDIGPETRSTKTIYIDSIPYTVNKAQLVERIADVVLSRKLPQLLDVKDLSTEDVRIAHRDEEGRRREDDHGVPLQAHAAADQLRRQPDVPRSRPRTPRSAGPSGSISSRSSGTSCTSASRSSPGGSSTSWPRSRSASTSSKASRRSSTRSTRSSGSSASRTARPTPPRRS